MQKWEYCVVGPIKQNFMGYYPQITFFTSEGEQTKSISDEKGMSETEILARTLASLGNDGWEMVGCGSTGRETHLLYFKRAVS